MAQDRYEIQERENHSQYINIIGASDIGIIVVNVLKDHK